MKIVPATEALSREYYGSNLPVTMRGYFLLDDDGKPIGAAGFIRKAKNYMVLFSEGKDEAFRDKKMVIRFGRMLMDIADTNGWTLLADADDTKDTAPRFLEHWGFELNEDGEYIRWPVQQPHFPS